MFTCRLDSSEKADAAAKATAKRRLVVASVEPGASRLEQKVKVAPAPIDSHGNWEYVR
jgi:hypothetical protein